MNALTEKRYLTLPEPSAGDTLAARERLLAVTDTEQRSLKNIYMTFLYQIGEELQEEGNQQQTDVHTVHIGICCHNHFVIS